MDKKISVLFVMLAFVFGPAQSVQSRSVNLALETSFLFDPKDIKNNTTLLKKVRNVLEQLKSLLDPNSPVFRHNGSDTDTREHINYNAQEYQKNDSVLSKFLTKLGSELIYFDDEEIKKFTRDLKEAVFKFAETDDFVDLCEDKRLRALILNSAQRWVSASPTELKLEVAKYIISKEDTDALLGLLQIANNVFDSIDDPKFKKLYQMFQKSIKESDYKKFLYKALDFIVRKKYNKLNDSIKRKIKDEMRNFTEFAVKRYEDRIVMHEHREEYPSENSEETEFRINKHRGKQKVNKQ